MKTLALAAILQPLLAAACGHVNAGSSPTGTDIPAPQGIAPAPAPPSRVFGSFAAADDAGEAAALANTVVVLPTYSVDPEPVAAALAARGAFAIVSAHHVFGGPREAWGVGASAASQARARASAGRTYSLGHGEARVVAQSVGGWEQTRAWMRPFEARGLVSAVYVVDEPLHNGISEARRDEAVAIVRAAGYRTAVAEWIDEAQRAARPGGVDYYGATCYDFPGPGSWTLERCLTAYRDRPQWNLVLGQAYDLQERNGSPAQQLAAWAALGREAGRAGILFWVWRWPGQVGIADEPAVLAAYRAVRG